MHQGKIWLSAAAADDIGRRALLRERASAVPAPAAAEDFDSRANIAAILKLRAAAVAAVKRLRGRK